MNDSWYNPIADNSCQSKICPDCKQENDRYGLPVYPFNKSTKGTLCTEDITTVSHELPPADEV